MNGLSPARPANSHERHDTVLQADLNILEQEAVLAAAQGIQHRLVLRAAGATKHTGSGYMLTAVGKEDPVTGPSRVQVAPVFASTIPC